MTEILKLVQVSNSIKKKAILKNVSFGINTGSFHAFIGENGAGKTTTMCVAAGIIGDYAGEIFFEDKLIKESAEKSILFIPERINFPSHLTSFKFVKLFSAIFLNKEVSDLEIDKLFEKFGILDIKNTKANKLSSGQKKKISLIRALISKPKLLLIDEPAANLDPTSRLKLFQSLKELNKEGTTILISSHIISELEKYVNAATIIRKGEIIWTGKLKKNELSKKYNKLVVEGSFYEK